MKITHPRWKITVDDATAQLPELGTPLCFVTMLKRGSMSVELYAPRGHDPQTPHKQDELYVVLSGCGEFVNGGERQRFGPGDVLFVPAGVEHHFENFSNDFQTWVIFYGPEGGELL